MDDARFDHLLCRQCRGRCCQGHPGLWSDPRRFFDIFTAGDIPSADKLSRLLEKRRLTLRDLGGVLIPAPRSTEAGCAFLKRSGCEYGTAERPCQCLALIPNLETLLDDRIHCFLPPDYGSNSARENWRPFQPLLRQVHSLTSQRNLSSMT